MTTRRILALSPWVICRKHIVDREETPVRASSWEDMMASSPPNP